MLPISPSREGSSGLQHKYLLAPCLKERRSSNNESVQERELNNKRNKYLGV